MTKYGFRIISALLSFVIISNSYLLTSCTTKKVTKEEYSWVLREDKAKQEYDYEGKTALPRASGETSKTVQYLEMDGESNTDLFLALSLQGNVNRQNPFMYIVRDEIIDNLAGINASKFWLDQIDANEYSLTKKNSVYEMLVENLSKISGYILYDQRLTDAKMTKAPIAYNNLYGDNAVLNLTVMLCAQYNAVALTRQQLQILRERYGINTDEDHINLPRLGDTTQFILKDNEGKVLNTPESRESREVWQQVYDYALEYVAPEMNDSVMAHGPAFQAANYDYYIQNKVFLYNRILDKQSTDKEKQTEADIFGVTLPNTAMMGVQYLQLDEHSLIPAATQHNKFSVCAYETFNLSWSSGLPIVDMPKPVQREIKLDESKIYVSFDYSEGDNYSYHSMRVPLMGDNSKLNIPIGWPVASTMFEIAPNIIEYYKKTWGEYDIPVCPEAGVGYVYTSPPESSSEGFYSLTSEYLKRNGSDTIRALKADMTAPLTYAENVDGLNAMLIGYLGEFGTKMWNTNEEANFLYRDTVYFRHYDGTAFESVLDYNGSYPAFFSAGMYGWNQDVNSVKALTEAFDDRFVVVTPSELAKLYKEYANKKNKDITQADIIADGKTNEMGFLYYATDHQAVRTDISSASRYADGKNFFTYKIDLRNDVSEADVTVNVSGRYEIEISQDNLHYAKVLEADRYYDNPVAHHINIKSFLKENPMKTIYVRVGDAIPENDSGAILYSINVTTDKARTKDITITKSNDSGYIVMDNASVITPNGRKGEFTYKLNLDESMKTPVLTIGRTDKSGGIEFSKDNKTFFDIIPIYELASSDVYNISELMENNQNGTIYIKFTGKSTVITTVKLTQLKTISEASFTANGTSAESAFLISGDNTTLKAPDDLESYRSLEGSNVLLYQFKMDDKIKSTRLDLRISGKYKVSVSTDSKNFNKVVQAETGSFDQQVYKDISPYVKGGDILTIKVELLDPNSDNAMRLYSIRLFTNLASNSLISRYERERKPDIVIKPELGKQKDDARFWTSNTDSPEYKLIDMGKSKFDHIFKNGSLNMRVLPDSSAQLYYKLDFSKNNAAFWLKPSNTIVGYDIIKDITKLRVDIDIAENYLIELSDDNGKTWTAVCSSSLPSNYNGGAANRKNQPINLTAAYKKNPVIIIRISCPVKTIHTGLVSGLYFYFN